MKYKKSPITDEEIQTYISKRIIIDQETECWMWTKALQEDGYGRIDKETRAYRHCRTRLAHRASYIAFVSTLSNDLVVRHRCNNRRCCNPNHLEAGTNAQNVADRSEAISDRSTAALVILRRELLSKLDEVDFELAKRNPPER